MQLLRKNEIHTFLEMEISICRWRNQRRCLIWTLAWLSTRIPMTRPMFLRMHKPVGPLTTSFDIIWHLEMEIPFSGWTISTCSHISALESVKTQNYNGDQCVRVQIIQWDYGRHHPTLTSGCRNNHLSWWKNARNSHISSHSHMMLTSHNNNMFLMMLNLIEPLTISWALTMLGNRTSFLSRGKGLFCISSVRQCCSWSH